MSGLHRSFRALILAMVLALPGCGALTRLSEIGRPPAMTPTADPTADPNWHKVTMPMPRPVAVTPEANSLWHQGSRAFFRDPRASQVGDIITVVVDLSDSANLKDETTQGRSSSEAMGVPNLFGLESVLPRMLTRAVNPKQLVDASSDTNTKGTGSIKRNETVQLRLAGVITQVLPNGNLVVEARQEVRVNSELRVLLVSGVVRPQDIASDNTVLHDRMAEARISYGGRGQLTDKQTPRYGQQVLDVLLPF